MTKVDTELLTVNEVANFFRVPTSWVYERCREVATNPLPHLKLGKYLRFSKPDLLQYLDNLRLGDSKAPDRKA